jgi:hypothetical protein
LRLRWFRQQFSAAGAHRIRSCLAPFLSVTTTQFRRKGFFPVLPSNCRKAAGSQRITRVNCVVAIAIGGANRVKHAIVVFLLSVSFNHSI